MINVPSITKLRLVSPGSLVSNKAEPLGVSCGHGTEIAFSREDWFMKIEIEYCGQ